MRFFGPVLLLFAVIEIVSIILMTGAVGGGWTLLLLFAGFIAGMLMLRNIGLSGVMMAGETLRSGAGISVYQLMWPMRFVGAALLFICPGFFSDLLALLLLIPFKGRRPADFTGSPFARPGNQQNPRQDDVIEGEFTVREEKTGRDTSPPKTGQ